MKRNVIILASLGLMFNFTAYHGQSIQHQMKTDQKATKKMQLTACTPNLMVRDVKKSIDFYTEVLGFELLQSAPKTGPLQWAYVKKGSTHLMFQSEASLKAEFKELDHFVQGGAFTFFIQVKDPEGWYEKVKDKVRILKPYGVTSYNGANEFVMMDINGFILHFSDITFE